jgi:Holliday junction DNA helicase RuvA
MIAFVEGKVEITGEKFTVLNAGGIGYKVFISQETSQKIPQKGHIVKLWTYQNVREDALELYGFLNLNELDLFETLIGVSGVGPKTALAVLGMGSTDNLRRAIAAGDSSYLTRVSGIGRKTAERIIVELKDKMAGRGVTVDAPELKEEMDALDALTALGYSPREARDALAKVPKEITEAEKRIKEVLKNLGKR